ncbi:MAG: phosphotransacetylase family protein [Candidatus Brocadiaceae bacterium]|nr:phosphotransacetylase family protein [Candidatus Brocadiaceae bacterium]
MIPVVIGSVTEFSGKSLIWLGVGLRFKEDGFRMGFFKPLGALPTRVEGVLVDEDAVFLKRAIAIEEPLDSICPVVITEEVLSGLLREAASTTGGPPAKKSLVRQKVMENFQRLSRDKDILLVHALGGLDSGTTVGLSMVDFVVETKGRVVLVDKFEDPIETLDAFLHAREVLEDKLLGVVFNLIPPAKVRHIKEVVSPYLKSKGIDTLGVIPKDPLIGAVPIRELVKVLEGEVLYGEESALGGEELVEHIMVGAMNVESALKYFRRVANKAVITGGDRSDIQLAALETPTRCLILTGGFYPSESILSRARENRIPVIIVKVDTATAVETCDSLSSHLQRWSEAKLPKIREVVDREIDFPLLYEKLELKKK